ncbi:hypothetical protein CENSYa_0567 [Cenarchaeum symbiosum A]|uniref:Uncharacterized protein n=1 Tax=Cenarchaeum symbiosum (strain A) TaxID=414004 RepID=A0RV33_CENSY|nr:hypothetical protein CENSYa_0567 [Cenarchaeum symbiosum A]
MDLKRRVRRGAAGPCGMTGISYAVLAAVVLVHVTEAGALPGITQEPAGQIIDPAVYESAMPAAAGAAPPPHEL